MTKATKNDFKDDPEFGDDNPVSRPAAYREAASVLTVIWREALQGSFEKYPNVVPFANVALKAAVPIICDALSASALPDVALARFVAEVNYELSRRFFDGRLEAIGRGGVARALESRLPVHPERE